MDFTHRDQVAANIAQTRAARPAASIPKTRAARPAAPAPSGWYDTAEEALAARADVHRDRMLNALAVRLHVRQQMMRCYDR